MVFFHGYISGTHREEGHLEVFRFVACFLYWMIYDLVLPACKGRSLISTRLKTYYIPNIDIAVSFYSTASLTITIMISGYSTAS
jgi:hypothetical protein